MKAAKLFSMKQVYRSGIVEMVIWKLPEADSERPHGLKYRLVYVRDGERLVGYDNERGKGDHRHYGGREEPYRFTDIDGLLSDFWSDVRAVQ
jgi:hypothetical protein